MELKTEITPESFAVVSRGTDVEVVVIRTATTWVPALTFQSEFQEGRIFARIKKQRGGARAFTSLDAAARCLADLEIHTFKIWPWKLHDDAE